MSIATALTAGSVSLAAPAYASTTDLPDPALHSCVVSALGPLGYLLDSVGLGGIVSLLAGPLVCTGDGITNLTDLGGLINLTSLDLSSNSITDIAGLSSLVDLDTLNLNGNSLTDLSSLQTLTGTLISATGQTIDLGSVLAGVPQSIPLPKDITGALVPLTSATGAVVGTIDTLNKTVTFIGDGVGTLTWSIAGFTGSIIANVTSQSFSNSATVGISGDTEYLGTLSTTTAGWANDTAFTYQWARTGVDVPGATAISYPLTVADIGSRMTVTATATKSGYLAKTVTSEQTHTIRKATISVAPVPVVSGTASVGSPLTAEAGTWTPGVTLAYQWSSGGTNVPGATTATFVPRTADIGKTIRVGVTGTQANYTTLTQFSVPTVAVTAANTGSDSSQLSPGGSTTQLKHFTKTYAPKIIGKPKVGKTLTASTPKWSKKVKFSYQWKVAGKKIAKATHKKLKVLKRFVGKKITVTIKAKRAGYVSVSRTSKSTVRAIA